MISLLSIREGRLRELNLETDSAAAMEGEESRKSPLATSGFKLTEMHCSTTLFISLAFVWWREFDDTGFDVSSFSDLDLLEALRCVLRTLLQMLSRNFLQVFIAS